MCADTEDDFLYIERNKKSDLDIQITSIGGFGMNEGAVGHLDLSYIESFKHGNALALDLGGGISFRSGPSFFLGIGFLLGYNFDEYAPIGAYYPQVGSIVHITKTFGIVATGRRYLNLYSNIEHENIVMIGLLFASY